MIQCVSLSSDYYVMTSKVKSTSYVIQWTLVIVIDDMDTRMELHEIGGTGSFYVLYF